MRQYGGNYFQKMEGRKKKLIEKPLGILLDGLGERFVEMLNIFGNWNVWMPMIFLFSFFWLRFFVCYFL